MNRSACCSWIWIARGGDEDLSISKPHSADDTERVVQVYKGLRGRVQDVAIKCMPHRMTSRQALARLREEVQVSICINACPQNPWASPVATARFLVNVQDLRCNLNNGKKRKGG